MVKQHSDMWMCDVYCGFFFVHSEIFERVIHLSLTAKKMKFFFKRYLDYEKKYGTPETVQSVKAAALEYVESKSSLAES